MRRAAPLVAALAGMSIGCTKQEKQQRPLTPVRAAAVETSSTAGETRYSANILPHTRVEVAFRVGGYVAALRRARGVDGRERDIQEGDTVPQGAVLARVRQDDYAVKVNQARSQLAEGRASLAAAKSQLAEAEAALRQAQIDFTRAKNLFEAESLTRADYDAASTRLDVARARVAAGKDQIEAIQARIAAARQQVAEAEIAFRDTELKAPIGGTVLKRTVEVGSLVGPGTPAFVLADTTSVKAVFGVPDAAVSQLKLGQPLSIQTEGIPGGDFAGRITQVAPAADSKSRLFEVELTVPNRSNRLRPGMIATVTIFESGPAKRVPVLPLNAIVPSKKGDHYAVFVVEQEGGRHVARMRDVRLGEAVGNGIAVIDGVKLGQLVVTNGSNLIADGEPVQLVP